jgi:hypothetical protein
MMDVRLAYVTGDGHGPLQTAILSLQMLILQMPLAHPPHNVGYGLVLAHQDIVKVPLIYPCGSPCMEVTHLCAAERFAGIPKGTF